MSRVDAMAPSPVPPEEVERRIAEMRRAFFERRLAAQVVYQPPRAMCPWPGCGLKISAIRFELEQQGTPDQVEHWLAAWWNGPGLVGRCPGCNQYVLFDVKGKQAVTNPADWPAVLPDDWHQKAYIIPRRVER